MKTKKGGGGMANSLPEKRNCSRVLVRGLQGLLVKCLVESSGTRSTSTLKSRREAGTEKILWKAMRFLAFLFQPAVRQLPLITSCKNSVSLDTGHQRGFFSASGEYPGEGSDGFLYSKQGSLNLEH